MSSSRQAASTQSASHTHTHGACGSVQPRRPVLIQLLLVFVGWLDWQSQDDEAAAAPAVVAAAAAVAAAATPDNPDREEEEEAGMDDDEQERKYDRYADFSAPTPAQQLAHTQAHASNTRTRRQHERQQHEQQQQLQQQLLLAEQKLQQPAAARRTRGQTGSR